MKTENCDLYRHYDKEWNLLYVGISLNAVNRMIQHRSQSKEWFDEIAFTQRKVFPSRAEAEKAESIAIRNENPKWNKSRPFGTASQDLLDEFTYGCSGLPPLHTRDEEGVHLVELLRNKVVDQGNSISFLHAEIKKLEAVGVQSEPTNKWKKCLNEIRVQLQSLEEKFKKHGDLYEENEITNSENWGFLMKNLGFEWHGEMPDGYWKFTKGGLLDSYMTKDYGELLVSDLRKEFKTHLPENFDYFRKVMGGVTEDHTLWIEALSAHLGFEWDSQEQELKKKKIPKGGKRAVARVDL